MHEQDKTKRIQQIDATLARVEERGQRWSPTGERLLSDAACLRLDALDRADVLACLGWPEERGGDTYAARTGELCTYLRDERAALVAS